MSSVLPASSTDLVLRAASPATAEPSTRRALVFVYAGYLFRYVYLLILIPFYGRVLGAQEYGRLLAAMSLYQVVWMLTEYGFPLVGARDIAAVADDPRRIAASYSRQMAARCVMAVPGLLVGIAGTWLSPLLREAPLFGALATANGLVAAFNLGWYFQGRLRFATSVVFELIGFAINLPLILLLVHGAHDGARVLASLLFSALLCTVAAHALALRGMPRVRAGLRDAFALVRESTALFAHKGVTLVMASSSTYLLSLFAPAAQVGWYGAAERLAAVGLSLMQPANHVLVGTVASRIGARETEAQAYTLMRQSLLLMTAFGVLLLAGTWLLARTMVPLILGPDFAPTVPMLYVLALTFPLAAFSQVTSTYVLIPLRRDALVSLSSLLGAAITVLAIFFVGPASGGLGVAWARGLGSALLAVVLLTILVREGLLKRIFRS